MSDKLKIKWNILRELFAPFIQEITKEHIEEFWIVSLVKIEVSKDYAYADFFITCQKWEDKILKFLSQHDNVIKRRIGKELQARKSPIIRFKIPKEIEEQSRIYSLLDSISKEYEKFE